MDEIVNDVGMALVEFAGGGRMAIALLGHGQRHDPHAGRRHGGQQRVRVLGRHQESPDAAHHLQAFAPRVSHRDRVEPVLRGQRIARLGAPQRSTQDAPAEIAVSQDGVRHDGLVGTMEGADAEVYDPGRDGRTVVGGAQHIAGQLIERRGGEPGSGGHGAVSSFERWVDDAFQA